MGFMLDRLGSDCAPLQFLRELTQNSVEAILRTDEKRGEIIWDVDWNRFELKRDGIYKLAIFDSGDGMSGPDMVQYINYLSSSIRPQSLQGNYGIGAKIAAATRNHEGLIYLSWNNAKGSMIHLWRDPRTAEYGLRQFDQPDGTYPYWLPIEDSVKPPLIKYHGTVVVLLGNSIDQHTMNAPSGAASPSRWISKYLNSRYFRFPDGITVRAREGWENPRSDTDRNILRKLTGQGLYLADHAESSGTVDLTAAVAHWWILREESALTQNSGFINSAGHIAAMHKDELYETETGRSATARLQQFGVIFGHHRVVIYVEPQEGTSIRLTTNTARTYLQMNGESLPWTEWAAQFRDKLPEEISALVSQMASSSTSKEHTKSIRERLEQIKDLFRLSRYKPTPTGDVLVDESSIRFGGKPLIQQLGRISERKGRGGGQGGRAGDIYSLFATEKGIPASEVKADPFPKTTWISSSDGTRRPEDLEDRAARFLPEQNHILINADFRVFNDMVNKYRTAYGDIPGAGDVIQDTVREWFEQILVETVLGVQALMGAKEWSDEDIRQALSDESLSAAVMPRYHTDFAVKRALGLRLGSLKQKA
jgi:hypothetical protein